MSGRHGHDHEHPHEHGEHATDDPSHPHNAPLSDV